MQERIIEICGLSKHYYKRSGLFSKQEILAVDNLSLDIKKGSIFGLLGPNGAGKTTTLNMISGILPASSGVIKIFGRSVGSKDVSFKARLGYLAEDNCLPDYLSLKELLEFLANIFSLSSDFKKKHLAWLVEVFALKDLLVRRIGALSAGQKRIAALAAAFVNDPQLLILDEPTVYLDPLAVKNLSSVITLLKEQGRTIIISSHILSQVEKLCEEVAIIGKGSLKFYGPLEELLKQGPIEDVFIKLTS